MQTWITQENFLGSFPSSTGHILHVTMSWCISHRCT